MTGNKLSKRRETSTEKSTSPTTDISEQKDSRPGHFSMVR